MLGQGAGDGQQVALRIRCGTCDVTINVESNLVAMLVSEGMFTCPSCHTQQSVNQVALQQHIKQSEVEKHLGLIQQRPSHQRLPQAPDVLMQGHDYSSIANTQIGFSDGLGKRKLHPSQLAGDDTAVKRLNLGVHSTQDGGGLRSAHSDLRPGLRNPNLDEEDDDEDEDVVRESAQTFQDYKPAKLKIGPPHSDPVVESLSLSAAEPPDIHYKLRIDDAIERECLSSLQLEAISYACQRHEQFLPSNQRCGFFIGDGAGVGKGRTIAGLILENWACGRKNHVWVSVSADLKHDARRDLDDVGACYVDLHPLNKIPYTALRSKKCGVENGVVFLTYSTLISSTEKGAKISRMTQILDWCRKDFDGLIVFDECHKAKNLVSDGGQATKTGLCVLKLQEQLPKARIVYCSATGATELRNMAYMVRLGLWGDKNGGFETFDTFKRVVGSWGVGAMELIAMDLKSRGMYLCRTLSYQGAEFEARIVKLTDSMKDTYTRACYIWKQLLSQFQFALENLTEKDRKTSRRVWSQFWSAHQRFFRQMCMTVKVADTVACAQRALGEGKCVVIGLQSTGESRMSEVIKERGTDLDDFASGLKETILQLLDNHYPLPTPTEENLLEMEAAERMKNATSNRQQIKDESSAGNSDQHAATENVTHSAAMHQPEMLDSSKQPLRNDDCANGSEYGAPKESNTGLAGLNSEGRGRTKRKSARQTIASNLSYEDSYGSSDLEDATEDGSSDEDYKHDDPDVEEEVAESESDEDVDDDDEEEEEEEVEEDSAGSVIIVSDGDEDDLSVLKPLMEQRRNDGGPSTTIPLSPDEIQMQKIAAQRYRVALKYKQEVTSVIEQTDLPSNPLDMLIDMLGGPEKVAEMTGRKGRMVRSDNRIRWEPRNASGADGTSLEAINVAEAGFFMSGRKLVAIISDAASAGISLHADRRHQNRRRRVHLTLELPWSADRAVQQFGRTHRSNQANAPQYRLMMTSLGGERRFAAAVARRLQSLGALTQGDRRAGPAGPSLGEFDYDSLWGRKALQRLYMVLLEQIAPPVFPSSGIVNSYSSFPAFCEEERRQMLGVGMIKSSVDARQLRSIVNDGADIPRFLNRLLGLSPDKQEVLFNYFLDILEQTVDTAKKDGRYDNGIMDIKATHVEIKGEPEVVWTEDSGGEVLHYTVVTDRGVSYNSAVQKFEDFKDTLEDCEDGSGFYKTRRPGLAGRFFAVLALKFSGSSDMFKIIRPATGYAIKQIHHSDLDLKFAPFDSEEDARELWTATYEASLRIRSREVHILGGSVLLIWGATSQAMQQLSESKQRQMRIVRLQTTDEHQQVVGILVPEDAIGLIKNALTTAKARRDALSNVSEPPAIDPSILHQQSNGQALATPGVMS